ncbi:MAG TPA: OmpA family protein [Gemmatimonadaceae bacterium]|jgi:outer membrane protein OmpA-like peptidoglycan-associated protein
MKTNARAVTNVVRSHLSPLVLAALAFGLPAAAQEPQPQPLPPMVVHADGEKAKFSGIVLDKKGDTIRLREGNVGLHTILLTDDTRISTPSGLFKMSRKKRDDSAIMPGLMMQVEGRGSADGTLVADEIHFSTRSMKVAQQINVGSEVTRSQVAANTDSIERVKRRLADSITHVNARVTNLDNYEERISLVVNFPTNVSDLADGARGVLDDMVNRAAGLKGYIIEVKGYADTSGTPAYNLQLSTARAVSVVRYLSEQKDIPLRRILNPTGYGSAQAIANNSTPDGRAMNRRATVRVLVSKGLANNNGGR